MTVLLSATGLFLYLRLARELDQAIDSGLRSRAADIGALVRQADSGLSDAGASPLADREESFAQILDAGGHVVDATPQLGGEPLLDRAELRRASRATLMLEREEERIRGVEDPARLLATPVEAQGQRLVVVAGASTDDRDEALENLLNLMLLGGPAALLLACAAGYGVAAAALRPVESMRRRATVITAADPGSRLPVPPARDEIGRLGHTLNDMLDRLELALTRERGFVADASHELRTPLAILKTELELALRGGRSPRELEAALRSAAEETDRLAQLAEDLLVIARSDRGRLPVRPVETAVRDVFELVASRHRRRAADGGREIVVEAEPDLRVHADPLRLEQALGNLVDNALRYGDGAVRLTATRTNGAVELHVLDEGSGFPHDLLDRAFERFTRADAARSRGGSGLGLAIVSSIATAHGGEARAANRFGGADVWLSLPGATNRAEPLIVSSSDPGRP